jgi:hypothetical protein
MSREDVVSRDLRELKEYAMAERDPKKLRDLVVEINNVLDVIEMQAAKLEGRKPQ